LLSLIDESNLTLSLEIEREVLRKSEDTSTTVRPSCESFSRIAVNIVVFAMISYLVGEEGFAPSCNKTNLYKNILCPIKGIHLLVTSQGFSH
jgi:hypothetical protein